MKKYFLCCLVSTSIFAHAQQNMPIGTEDNKSFTKGDPVTPTKGDTENDKHFTLFGIGNLSDETLKALNAGGKLAIRFVPHPDPDTKKHHTHYFVSFNKNASNTDSLFSTTLVFPEVGNHSALFTVNWKKYVATNTNLKKYNAPFVEFVFKKIKREADSGHLKNEEVAFNSLHYTAGYSWGFEKERTIENKMYNVGCNLALFLSFVNIPNEDHQYFEQITGINAFKNSFFAAGVKTTFEINGFQIFADLRHVFRSADKLPLKDLKGFNSNIGVAFNTDIFSF